MYMQFSSYVHQLINILLIFLKDSLTDASYIHGRMPIALFRNECTAQMFLSQSLNHSSASSTVLVMTMQKCMPV